MAELTRLFEKGRIGQMDVSNRIVMAPMGTFSGKDGFLTDNMIDFYVERARNGAGLIITQFFYVCPEAPGGMGTVGLWHDKYIPQLKKLTDAVHRCGAKIATQPGHHGIQQADPGRLIGFPSKEIDIVGPSAVTFIPTGVTARAASLEDIKYLVEAHAEANRRTKEAGFDAVEIHLAHGKLPCQFMSPFFNKRKDKYGGSLENRARFACEIIDRTRSKVGPDYPVLVRMDGSEGFEGGYTVGEAVQFARLFEEAGADAIDVSAGVQWYSTEIPTYLDPPGAFVPLAAAIKKAVKVPVIAVGRLTVPMAEKILRQGQADFIAFGRPFLVDSELARKARENRIKDIKMCILCLNCIDWAPLFSRYKENGIGLRCTMNPALLREREFSIQPVASPKEVMVIGGGPAGMKAAAIAAARGHRVTLYEKGETLGGQLKIASMLKWKRQYAGAIKDLLRTLSQNQVKVVLNKEVSREVVEKERPDIVIVATGSNPVKPAITGADGKNVVQVRDVISGKTVVGDRVVVVGGRYRGIDAALFLAESGKKVSIVTRHKLGRDMSPFISPMLRDRLIELGVYIYPESEVIEIRDNGVNVVSGRELFFLKADTVVLAVGAKPENRLVQELDGLAASVYAIGDCIEPRSALEAIYEGAEIGRKV